MTRQVRESSSLPFSSFLGFGTKVLRNYSYAKIGKECTIRWKKLSKNLTCTACISRDTVEMLKFFSEGK